MEGRNTGNVRVEEGKKYLENSREIYDEGKKGRIRMEIHYRYQLCKFISKRKYEKSP